MQQPKPFNEETNTLANEDTPLKKETLPTEAKEKPKKVQKASKKYEKTPAPKANTMLVSNEDLKRHYERGKNRKTNKEFRFKDAHRSGVTSVTVTSDNKFIISGSDDKSIKIFDLQTKELVHHFENAHEDMITSVAVTSNRQYIISGSRDKSIKVFDLYTKEQVHHFENAHEEWVQSVIVTSDNRHILSGSSDKSIKIFDLQNKCQVHHFKDAHKDVVVTLAVTSDNKYIISGSCDKSIKVFDFENKCQVFQFEQAHKASVSSMALTSDDRYVVAGSSGGSLKIFDLQTKQEVHNFQNAHKKTIFSMALTSDSRFAVTCSWDNSIKVFDLQTKQQVHHWQNAHDDNINTVVVTNDDRCIISGSWDNSIKMFELQTEQTEQIAFFQNTFKDRQNPVVVTPNKKYMVSTSQDKHIKITDFQTKQHFHTFARAHQADTRTTNIVLTVTPDSKYIISGSNDQSIKIFDIEAKTQVHHIENAHLRGVTSLAVTSDGKYIVSGSDDKSIKVFDFKTKQQVHEWQNAHEDAYISLVVTSDNRYIVSASEDKSIKVFDFQTKRQVHEWQNAHEQGITSLALTSDDKYIVSGSHDRSVRVFDLRTKQRVYYFQKGHKNGITSVNLTPDNRYIVVGSWDKFVTVLALQTQQQIHHFRKDQKEYFGEGGSLKGMSEDQGSKASSTKDEPSIPIQDPAIFDQDFYFIYQGMKKFSVMSGVDDFLFDASIEYSVSQATKQPELFVFPYRWNILHIVSIYANHSFIQKMPGYDGFKMPFLLDAFNHTPFHYLIAHKNVHSITVHIMFRYLCDYLEDSYVKNPFEFQRIIQSISSLLPFIFQKIEMKARQRFLRIIYRRSPAPYGNPLPIFGSISSEAACFCESPVLTQETREKIWSEEGNNQVEFRSNFLHLDYDISSEDMKSMVDCLQVQEGEEFFRVPVITRLIDHLWGQAETPMMIFFMLYSAFIIALSVYLTFNDRSLAYEVTLLAISGLFTANEFWQMFHLKRAYLENLWNWIDLSQLLLTIAFLVARIADNNNELARAWISTIIILLGYIRWISLLKIFKPTRNLIQVVITIVKDMVSFIIIIALIIVGFSVIFLVFNREAGYGDYLYEAYNVLYGPVDIEDGAAWPFSQKLIMAVLAFFLNVVLLNLLISIMGDSYGKVLEMRDRTDALTRLEMISEAVIYKKLFKPRGHETKRGYLVYCLPMELEEEEDVERDQKQELEGGIKMIQQIIQQNNEGSKQELQSLKASNDIMREKMLAMEEKISRLETSNNAMKNEVLAYLQSEFSKLKTSGENHPNGGFLRRQTDNHMLKKDLLEDNDDPQPE